MGFSELTLNCPGKMRGVLSVYIDPNVCVRVCVCVCACMCACAYSFQTQVTALAEPQSSRIASTIEVNFVWCNPVSSNCDRDFWVKSFVSLWT